MKALIIEDHPLVATITQDLLSTILVNYSFEVINELPAIEKLSPNDYTLVVADLLLGEVSAEETFARLQTFGTQSKKIFLSSIDPASPVAQSIKAQGHLFLSKTTSIREVVAAINDYLTQSGKIDFERSNEFRSFVQLPGRKPLTLKQASVMELVVEGLTGKEVAKQLGMSPDTVRAHIKAAYERLGSSSRAQAISNYIQAKKLATLVHEDQH